MLHSAILAKASLLVVSLTVLLSGNATAASAVDTNSRFIGDSSSRFGLPSINEETDPDAMFSTERLSPKVETFLWGEPGPNSMQNSLTFSGTQFETNLDQTFSVGTLSYLNGQTFEGTNVTSVPLEVSFDFIEPAGQQVQAAYQFGFNLTPNDEAANSADRLTVMKQPDAQTFTIADQSYQLDLLGFSRDNAVSFADSFLVPEDSVAQSTLFARIRLAASSTPNPESPVAVPEPSMMMGLLALGGYCLRKRIAQ